VVGARCLDRRIWPMSRFGDVDLGPSGSASVLVYCRDRRFGGQILWSSSETSGKMKEERQSWILLISISAKISAPS
jgi:hypothetical protein